MTLRTHQLGLTRGKRAVLHDVSTAFAPGEVTVILGPNGAGKSSLLSCLAGLSKPDAGEVTLDGQCVTTMPPRERARRIGLLPQRAEVHWGINVRALVALGRLPHTGGWGSNAADAHAIEQAMERTDCAAFADANAQHLSGGEQARVLLARALAGEPQWLLADEPLANLDPAHQLDALACLRQTAQHGVGIVLVLHDLTQAIRIADRLIVMDKGTIAASGPAGEVLTPDLLRNVFAIRAHLGQDGDGAPLLVPVARA